jgi:iron complex outermembrane receptor protein
MKNLITLFVFLITVSILQAQKSDTSLTYTFEDVEIKENRLIIPFSQSARNINIITKKDLTITPSVSYVEALNYVTGIDVRQRGALGVQADICIRGGTFEQSLILINGIKMNDPQTGHHNSYLPIALSNIEQIEVIKGTAARIYGQNAFTGAINIVTKIPEERKIFINSSFGQNTLLNGFVGASIPIGKYKQFISANYTSSEGYRYNTDFNIKNIFYQSEIKLGDNKLGLQGGYIERAFGANGFYASPSYTEQYEEVTTAYGSINYDYIKNNVVIKPRIYVRYNHDNYIFVRDNPSIYQNLHTTNIIGSEVHSNINTNFGTIGLGLEYRKEKIESTNLGNHNRDIGNLFAEYRFNYKNWNINSGVSFNYYSDYNIKAFPSIDISYNLTSKIKAFGMLGNAYRIPTYTDLYYVGPTNIGNPNLKPESAILGEIGFKYNYKGVFCQISSYYQNATDLIDWTRTADSLPWQPTNLNQVISFGGETSIDVRFEEVFKKDTYFKRFYVGYHYINAKLSENINVNSRYALEHLNNQLSISIEHRIYRNFYNTIKMRYIDRAVQGMENYTLFDAKVFYKKPKYQLFIEGTNLFNTEYTETNLVIMPKRWVRGGFAIEL